MANEFKVKNGLILESGSLSNTSQQFILTYNTSSGQVFYASGSGGGGSGAGFPFVGDAIITGSLTVSGSGITVTGSLNAPNITGSLLGTASQAYTSSYAIGYPRIIQQGAYDNLLTIGNPFPTFTSQYLNFSGNFKYWASASLTSLLPGTYQIYLNMFVSTINVGMFISPNSSFPITSTSTLNVDPNRLIGSAARGLSAGGVTSNVRLTTLTPKFTITSPTQYYIHLLQLNTISTVQIIVSIGYNVVDSTQTYIIYKYDD